MTDRERGQMEAYADALHAVSQDHHFAGQFDAADDRLGVLRGRVEQMSGAWSDWSRRNAG